QAAEQALQAVANIAQAAVRCQANLIDNAQTTAAQDVVAQFEALEKHIASVRQDFALRAGLAEKWEPLATVELSSEGQKNGMVAEVFGPGEDEYGEFSICVSDSSGEYCADVILGMNPNMEPRVATTTDGNWEGEKDLNVFPMRPAETAVEHDLENAKRSRWTPGE